jgi:hypothetical protein
MITTSNNLFLSKWLSWELEMFDKVVLSQEFHWKNQGRRECSFSNEVFHQERWKQMSILSTTVGHK